jgi:hypothetical protein
MPPGRRNNCSQQLILVAVDLLAYAASVNRTTRESSGGPDDVVRQPDRGTPITQSVKVTSRTIVDLPKQNTCAQKNDRRLY